MTYGVFCPNLSLERIRTAKEMYAAAKPYSHVILDGWFNASILDEVFPLFYASEGWQSYENGKRASRPDHSFLRALNEPEVLAVLRAITGDILLPDPTMRGAGLHEVSHGGRLGIHVDFNRHPTLPLVRRVNTILYMNDEWRAEWNGALTLTDRKGCDQRIPPVWNRWVIFKYGPESWHGHPEPWLAPEGTPRRSIAMYYYQPLEGDLAFTGTNYAQ